MINNKRIQLKDLEKDYIVKEIGKGITATCYLTKDGQVYKKFNGIVDYNKLSINKLVNYSCPYITFPKTLIYEGNELVGYIKEYANGTEVDKLDDSIDMRKLIIAIKEMELYMLENYYHDIFMFTDLSGENIVYNQQNNKLSIIDADFFELLENGTYMRDGRPSNICPYIENNIWLAQSFYSITKDCEGINIYIDRTLNEVNAGFSPISISLRNLINELENITNEQIVTLCDFRNAVKKAKEISNGKTRIRHR